MIVRAQWRQAEVHVRKDTKTGNINEPDTDTYQADYTHEEEMVKVKQLETCGLGPDEEGICAPEKKKSEHVYVSE